jgi:signal transduction histidine kinase
MQEAFENIVRHAAAHHITVKWVIQANELTFLIMDDGQGFLPEDNPNNQHFGLRGMRERARMMGGNLNVSSQPGHGTSISLAIKVSYGD